MRRSNAIWGSAFVDNEGNKKKYGDDEGDNDAYGAPSGCIG